MLHSSDIINWNAWEKILSWFLKVLNHSWWRKIRGRKELSQNVKQNIYDTRIKNSINSTDGRNGRNLVKLSKRKYIEQYGTIKNNEVVIEEVKNKCGQTYYFANRMIITCTIRSIQDQLSQQGIVVSYAHSLLHLLQRRK